MNKIPKFPRKIWNPGQIEKVIEKKIYDRNGLKRELEELAENELTSIPEIDDAPPFPDEDDLRV